MDNGYIVTKSNDGYNILLYTYNEVIENLLNPSYPLKKSEILTTIEKEISLNITNVDNDSRIIFYEINEKVGSSYNYWLSMGSPERLNNEEMEILSKASFPKIEFKYSKKSSVLNIITKLKGYGATLILINPMKSKKKN
jgi:beta-xylosidase